MTDETPLDDEVQPAPETSPILETSDADRVVSALELLGGRVANLIEGQDTLAGEMREQRKSSRRMKVWQFITVIGLCADFGLSWLYFSNQHKENHAIALGQNNAVATCQATNATRAKVLDGWVKFINIADQGGADSVALAQLRAEQTSTYAPTDCSKLEAK